MIYSFYTGAIMFLIYYMGINEGAIILQNGWTQDLFSFGVLAIMTVIIQHHVHIAFMMRNWTILFALLWLFSLA